MVTSPVIVPGLPASQAATKPPLAGAAGVGSCARLVEGMTAGTMPRSEKTKRRIRRAAGLGAMELRIRGRTFQVPPGDRRRAGCAGRVCPFGWERRRAERSVGASRKRQAGYEFGKRPNEIAPAGETAQ